MDLRKKYKFKKRYILYIFFIVGFIFYFRANISFTTYAMIPEHNVQLDNLSAFNYDLPLDKNSPWPKFRCNSMQNGRTSVQPIINNLKTWRIETGKGIFSSPVVDGDGTVYIGSGDHYFYAIDQYGVVKWKYKTDEIIDSSGLLDDQGNIFIGSGDGYVYAFRRETGELLWKFKAHTPQEVTDKFGIKTYNLNWFEGNIGILQNGNLIAPNDNYLIYEIERKTGKYINHFAVNEMVWSLPAINTKTNRLFFGSNFAAVKNTFCYDLVSKEKKWSQGGFGTNAASSLLTSLDKKGAVVIGGYDGYLRAYAQQDGFQIWKFATRDHIYSSPAQLSDGTIIQASVDGSIYAIDPKKGKPVWVYDTNVNLRSSPAIDGKDNIYIGTGDGKLLAINPDGTFRWAYQCIDEERNDMNSSPAIGHTGIYIAGESGGIFFIPFDYPLTEAGKSDPHSITNENKLADGVHLIFTNPFGNFKFIAPDEIEANQGMTFTLIVKENGNAIDAVIDKESLSCSFSGDQEAKVDVSAEGRFMTIIPKKKWTDKDGGIFTLTIKGFYISNMKRFGLKHFWGKKSGEFSKEFKFTVKKRRDSEKMPYKVPDKPGDPNTIFEYGRLSAPNPSILPSYNQIGFESLRYHLGIVEGSGNKAVLWGIQAKQSGDSSIANPDLDDRFPLLLDYDGGLLTLSNEQGFLLDFNGSWEMPYEYYRLSTKTDSTGKITGMCSINAIADCDKIEFYGYFLKLMGMSDFKTGMMNIAAGADLRVLIKSAKAPVEIKNIQFRKSEKQIAAIITGSNIKKSDYLFSILLIDSISGIPFKADYANNTLIETDVNEVVTKVILYLNENLKGRYRAYLMLDTYPVYKAQIN